MQHIGKPFYLFESTVLRSLGTLLLGRITREDAKNIPQVKRSTFFPYREASGTVFSRQSLTLIQL